MYHILYLVYCLPEMKNEGLINFYNHSLLSHLFFLILFDVSSFLFLCLFIFNYFKLYTYATVSYAAGSIFSNHVFEHKKDYLSLFSVTKDLIYKLAKALSLSVGQTQSFYT